MELPTPAATAPSPIGDSKLISGVAARVTARGPVGARTYASADASRQSTEKDVDMGAQLRKSANETGCRSSPSSSLSTSAISCFSSQRRVLALLISHELILHHNFRQL